MYTKDKNTLSLTEIKREINAGMSLEEDISLNVYQKVEGSTNTILKEMALQGAGHGTIIIANEQTAGRGRHGRPFFSPPDCGIYMSILTDPKKMSFNTPTLITAYTAVAVCKSIETLCLKAPGIKWVNDIFLDGKKICGISAEAIMDAKNQNIQWIIVGIGINFTLYDDLPENLTTIVGAIFENETPNITRNELAADLINRMMDIKHTDINTDINTDITMINEYRKRLFIRGKKVKVEGAKIPYIATVLDVDDIGRLIVKNENKELITLTSGEVSLREIHEKSKGVKELRSQ